LESLKLNKITEEMGQIIQEHGAWTAHNIQLCEGLYTIGGSMSVEFPELVNIISDFNITDFSKIRVLDLGCLEGGHSVTFARTGAQVVGIEGRKSNFVKANFAKKCNNFENLNFLHEDVRKLNCFTHGYFEVVICSGILYHLDYPDVFEFIQKISECCTNVAYINTHFSIEDAELQKHNFPNLGPIETVQFDGKSYKGAKYLEHTSDMTLEQKESNSWSSIGNETSFWPTLDSLVDMIKFAGFSRIYRIMNYWNLSNRCCFIAVK
jgi:cyclopropane fatty-acyl-phospholipid synthase-like methyltransferase